TVDGRACPPRQRRQIEPGRIAQDRGQDADPKAQLTRIINRPLSRPILQSQTAESAYPPTTGPLTLMTRMARRDLFRSLRRAAAGDDQRHDEGRGGRLGAVADLRERRPTWSAGRGGARAARRGAGRRGRVAGEEGQGGRAEEGAGASAHLTRKAKRLKTSHFG